MTNVDYTLMRRKGRKESTLFAGELKRRMKVAGISVRHLAEITQITESSIRRYRSGQQRPSNRALDRMRLALGDQLGAVFVRHELRGWGQERLWATNLTTGGMIVDLHARMSFDQFEELYRWLKTSGIEVFR